MPLAVRLDGVSRVHRSRRREVRALEGVSLELPLGGALAVVGPSGAGKSTLLQLVAGLDLATTGTVEILGHDLGGLSQRALTAFRAQHVGIVFQDDLLIPGLTALENVAVAATRWRIRRAVRQRAGELLDEVGLADRADFPPGRLSGGERQRVGIARALVGDAELLVADEPTGNLDADSTGTLLALLDRLRATRQLTLVVATHDPLVAAHLPDRLRLERGRLAC